MNNVVLIGRLTKDPELRYVPVTGNPVCKFTLAVDRGLSKEKKQEAKSKGYPTADFINITIWGKAAENCANFLGKGRMVAIQGRIQTESYEKDGKRMYATYVLGTQVEFLDWRNKNKQDNNDDLDIGDLDGFRPADDEDIPF